MNTANYTPEQIKKAMAAKSPEELAALAKEYGIELTTAQAQEYFAKLHPQSGELADEELDNISGGGCGSDDDDNVDTASPYGTCDQFSNKYGNASYYPENGSITRITSICRFCSHYSEDNRGKHCALRE